MKSKISLLCALLAIFCLGMGDKPKVTIRFHVQANAQDTERFSSPLHLDNPSRDIFIEKIPSINERMFKAIYPFQAANGTWGCSFKLDEGGRLSLGVMSTEKRGQTVVAILGTKAHSRLVIAMLIDKPINDGVITIPYGLTELEIAVLSKEYPVLGQEKNKNKKTDKGEGKPDFVKPNATPVPAFPS
ncbi:MAG TPA: hypothetical protein VK961_11925 [Chthoniobacter sp.]|nr:hypothetical protein [Chthoniobacter sp.]